MATMVSGRSISVLSTPGKVATPVQTTPRGFFAIRYLLRVSGGFACAFFLSFAIHTCCGSVAMLAVA